MISCHCDESSTYIDLQISNSNVTLLETLQSYMLLLLQTLEQLQLSITDMSHRHKLRLMGNWY